MRFLQFERFFLSCSVQMIIFLCEILFFICLACGPQWATIGVFNILIIIYLILFSHNRKREIFKKIEIRNHGLLVTSMASVSMIH
jgi:hypothetical protein